MGTRGDSRSLIKRCICLALVVTVIAANDDVCDKTKCPGPLRYYDNLGCIPVYKNPGDCCAIEYNCDHLKALSKEKCYVNGHEYNVGEALRDEDKNSCDTGCRCHLGYEDIGTFVCTLIHCLDGSAQEGCYRKNSPSNCCPGEEACPEKDEDRPTCVVDGTTYRGGEYFDLKSEPETTCVCMDGYKGENVEPFCKKPNRKYCDPIFHHARNVHNNCTPLYYSNQSPQTDCNTAFRCQNENDTVIHNRVTSKSDSTGSTKTCQFGHIVMNVGDELNQGTDFFSACVKCICEIPPVPTCQRLPDAECDITKRSVWA